MNKKGFTLIEIMVVLVILVSLTVGGIFGINEVQNKSKDKALKELYTKIENAADVYISVNEGYAIDLLNGKTDEKCLKLYTLQNEGLLSRDLVNPYTNKKLDSDSCVLSFLNDKGELENSYELNNKGETHRIDIEVVGGTSSEKYKYGYTKVTFNVDYEENKEIKSVTCDGGANTSFSDKVIVVNKINKDQKCTVVIDYIRWNVLVEAQGGSAIPSNSQVINGTNHEVKLVPNAGYNLNNLTENDYTCTGHDDYSLNNDILIINNITKDIKCTINFKDNYYIVKFTATGATISPENTSVKHGSSKEFTITPSTGYTLTGASSTCGSISGNKLTINNITSNMDCTLKLELDYFPLVITKGTGISTIYYKIDDGNYVSTTSNVNVKVKYGSTYYYYAVPSTGYTLNKCTESDPCSGIMNENGKSDALSSVLNKYTLTLSKGTGVSTIYYKVNGANSYESTTNTSINLDVNYNSTYYYYAAPNTGYTVSTCSASSPCTGTMGTSAVSKTLSATVNKYTLTLTKGTGVSTIYYKINGASSYTSASSTQSLSVNYGSTYYYYGASSTGYTMNACTSSSPCTGTMGTNAVSITLSATLNKYTINVVANNSSYGTVSPTSQIVEHGKYAIITLSPNVGYAYSSVSCTGGATQVSLMQGVKLYIGNITQSQNCTVTFKQVGLASIIKSKVVTSGEGVYNENGYRYEGTNPDNYIKMKKSDGTYEMWRIIGVFNDGTSGEEVVRVRKYYAVDSYPTMTINSSSSTNHFPNTSMYRTLSSTYSLANYTNTVNFKIYLGSTDSSSLTASSWYTIERGSTPGKTASTSYSSTVLFTGPVSIIYPSDYGYSVLASDCARTTNLTSHNNPTACSEGTWMYHGTADSVQWMITPSATAHYNYSGYYNRWGGVIGVELDYVYNAHAYSPVMALKATTTVTGSGTYVDPYVVV